MQVEKGRVVELVLRDGQRAVHLSCRREVVPRPGQYLFAGDGSDVPLPVPLFYTDSAPDGFIAAPPAPARWSPGLDLKLRGPLGRGFAVPAACRRAALVALDGDAARLRGLISTVLEQDGGVVLVCAASPEDLPDAVEVQPLSELSEVLEWADYIAVDVAREHLAQLKSEAGLATHRNVPVQVLIRTPVPCGGLAECGVCAVRRTSGWSMACRNGPVFDLPDLS